MKRLLLVSFEKDPDTTTGSEAVTGRLQDLLQQLIAPQSIHHAVVTVVKGDDTFRWTGAACDAHQDGTPIRADTPVWIASVTKLYIAGAILKLVERGLICLDAPMSTHLPQSLIGGLHRATFSMTRRPSS